MITYLYKDGKKHGSGTGFTYPKTKNGFVWLHVVKPNENEIEKIRKDFNISKKVFEKYLKQRQRSMRHSFSPLSFTIIDYYTENGRINLEEIFFVVGENYLVTMSKKHLPHYTDMFNLAEKKLKELNNNVAYILYEILDYDVEVNFDVLAITDEKVSDIEKKVLSGKAVIDEIVELKRYMLKMQRRFWSTQRILFSIKKGLTPIKMNEKLFELFDDIHDTFAYQTEIASSQRELLTDTLTIYESTLSNRLAKISNRINISLKKLTWIMFVLTGIATVLTVPNTLATIFGIPTLETNWQMIAAILLISLLIPTIWFYIFWKKFKDESK
ncbi:MAG: CorA family divalent cation transporter [Candidatus Aenigmatarchaeota archaeon]